MRCATGARAQKTASVVAVSPLAPLVTFLGLDRQSRNRSRFKTFELYRLACFLAITVSTVLDTLQRSIDFGDQFALPVTGAQLNRAVGLRGCAVGEVRVILAFLLQVLEGLFGLLEDVLPPIEQLQPEILPLALVHERLFVARLIAYRVHPKARSVTPAVLLRLVRSPPTFALGHLHLRVLPQPTVAKRPLARPLLAKLHDSDNKIAVSQYRRLRKPIAMPVLDFAFYSGHSATIGEISVRARLCGGGRSRGRTSL